MISGLLKLFLAFPAFHAAARGSQWRGLASRGGFSSGFGDAETV